MFGILSRSKPEVEIGPDGMSDYGRQMRREWALRDEAMAKIQAAIAEKTGIGAELLPHLPYEYLTLALLLNIRMDGAS